MKNGPKRTDAEPDWKWHRIFNFITYSTVTLRFSTSCLHQPLVLAHMAGSAGCRLVQISHAPKRSYFRFRAQSDVTKEYIIP